MKKKPPKKTESEHELIDIGIKEIEDELKEMEERECPICRLPIVGPRSFCMKCGRRLSKRKDEEKNKIIGYFNYIQSVMERSMQAVEETKKDDMLSKWSIIDDKISRNPQDANLYFQKGVILNGLGAYERALNAFNEVLDLDRGNTKAWIAKAYVLTRQKRVLEASKCYLKGLDAILKVLPEKIPSKVRNITKDQVSLISAGPETKLKKGEGLTSGLTNGIVNGLTNGVRRRWGVTNGLTNGITNGMVNGVRRRRGVTNGLTNGITNGMVNGVRRRGLTNGFTNGVVNGLTNGLRNLKTGVANGLTNGNGITNGLGGMPGKLETKGRKLKFMVVPIIVIFLILLPNILGQLLKPPGPTIEIDGKFGDWNGIESTSDMQEVVAFNPNVDIITYRVFKERGFLSFFLEVEGVMMAGQPEGLGRKVDTAHIFIDIDQEFSTGYQINGIGADYLIRIYGWNEEIYEGEMFYFIEKVQDWNNWKKQGHIRAIAKGSGLETQVSTNNLNLENGDHIDAYFHMQSWDGFEDFSDTVISDQKGVLTVSQQGVGEGQINGNSKRLLRLDLRAENADITVSEIKLTRQGRGDDDDVSAVRMMEGTRTISQGVLRNGVVDLQTSILLLNGEDKTLYIEVDVGPYYQVENSIGFGIKNLHNVTTDKGAISLKQNSPDGNRYDVSYIQSVPQEIKVDGAFADWENKEILDDTTGDVDNENLDIIEYGISNSSHMFSFYLRVDGKMGWGTSVPYWHHATVPLQEQESEPEPEPGPGPTPPAPPTTPKKGEDMTYIYIDSDDVPTTGFSIGEIGADHMIEIKGKYGEITSKKHLSFYGSSPFQWKWFDEGEIDAELDSIRLETQVWGDELDITGNFSVYFQTTDWSETISDYSTEDIGRGSPTISFRGTRYVGDALLCTSGTTPTIDGDYQSAEWSDATSVSNGDLTVYVKMDATNVYFAVTTTDTSEDNNDICAIYFETDHANDGVDDSYDKKFQTRYVGFWFDEWYEGTASGWPAFGESPAAGHIIAENLESGVGMEYEAQVPRSTLNDANSFDEAHEKIGFAVIVLNAGAAYEEWPDGAVDEPSGNSDSWGELEIPEFKDAILPVIGIVMFYVFWERKKKEKTMKTKHKIEAAD